MSSQATDQQRHPVSLLMPPAAQTHETTRVDALDGVRTVAVLLVVLFHLAVPHLAVGFIGVDIFFVLSGYLITTRLAGELAQTGTIDLLRFWARRAQRLIPAAMLLLISVSCYGWFVARPYQRPTIGGDLTASMLYYANWHFIDDGSYFAVEAQASPLHHMWSLSLEEQFYILWPLVLLTVAFATKILRLPRHWLVGLVFGVCLGLVTASFLDMQWLLQHPERPDRPYMGTDAKAFEPLIGALLALALAQEPAKPLLTQFARPAGWAGLLLVGGLLPFLHVKSRYYDGGALLFCLAVAALLLGLLHAPGFAPARVFSWAPVAYLGRISYGIYLWHWPLALLLKANQTFRPVQAALVLILTVAIAATSYHVMEQPILNGHLAGWHTPRKTMVTAATLMLGMVLAVAPLGGSFATPLVTALRPERDPSPSTVMLVGDSVPYHLLPTLDRVGTSRGLTIINGTRRGCSPLGTALRNSAKDTIGAQCVSAAKTQEDRLKESRPGTVVWWSRYEVSARVEGGQTIDVDDPRFWKLQQASLQDSVNRLTVHGARLVIVLTERPSVGMRTRCTPNSCPSLLDRLVHRDDLREKWNRLVLDEAARDPRIHTISVEDLLCPIDAPKTTGADVNLCNDRLPNGEPRRPDGTHVNLNGFDEEVSRLLLQRAVEPAKVR